MRGTFVEHALLVGQQARRHAAATPRSCCLRPRRGRESRWPPSISRVDTHQSSDRRTRTRRDRRSRLRSVDAESLAHRRAASLDERADFGGVAPPSLTMKLPCVGETQRAAHRARPSARRDRPARRPTAECPSGTVHAGRGILEDAAGARRRQRLRALAIRQRRPRDGAQRGGIARADAEVRRQHDLAACAAAGCGRSRTPSRRRGRRRPIAVAAAPAARRRRRSPIQAPAPVRVAVDSRRRPCPACRPRLRAPRARARSSSARGR